MYVIRERKSEVVYSVLAEGEKDPSKIRVLHRNMLLPVSQWFEIEKQSKRKPGSVKRKEKNRESAERSVEVPCDSESEEEGEWVAYYPVLDQNIPAREDPAVSDRSIPDEPEEEVVESDTEETVGYNDEEARRLLEELTPVDAEEIANDVGIEVADSEAEGGQDMEVEGETDIGENGERNEIDNAVENGIDGNVDGADNVNELEEEMTTQGSVRTRRMRVPARKFTYDELGVPSSVEMTGNVGAVDAEFQACGGDRFVDTSVCSDRLDSYRRRATIGQDNFTQPDVSVPQCDFSTTNRSVAAFRQDGYVQPCLPDQQCYVAVPSDINSLTNDPALQYVPVRPNLACYVGSENPYQAALGQAQSYVAVDQTGYYDTRHNVDMTARELAYMPELPYQNPYQNLYQNSPSISTPQYPNYYQWYC